MDLDPEEYWGIFTSVRAYCPHSAEHIIGTRHSVGKDGVDPCWLGTLDVLRRDSVGPIVYFAESKYEAIAQGIRRLVSGDCACPEGAFYRGVLAQRARYKSLLAADAAL